MGAVLPGMRCRQSVGAFARPATSIERAESDQEQRLREQGVHGCTRECCWNTGRAQRPLRLASRPSASKARHYGGGCGGDRHDERCGHGVRDRDSDQADERGHGDDSAAGADQSHDGTHDDAEGDDEEGHLKRARRRRPPTCCSARWMTADGTTVTPSVSWSCSIPSRSHAVAACRDVDYASARVGEVLVET